MSKSIIQNKDGCCYMCDLLGTRQQGYTIEEHHCFGGPNRKLSEKYGLKVYLCPEHHRTGPDAVHQNSDYMQILHEAAHLREELHLDCAIKIYHKSKEGRG